MHPLPMITISRQYGSGGRQIGLLLAEQLGIPFYDKEIIALAAGQSQIHESFFEKEERSRSSDFFYGVSAGSHFELPLSDRVYLAQADVIRQLAAKGPGVFVGRCADEILNDLPYLFKVFVYAGMESRVRRVTQDYGDQTPNIRDHIAKIDKKRAYYYHFYTNKKFGIPENYDLCLNTDFTGIHKAVQLLQIAATLNDPE